MYSRMYVFLSKVLGFDSEAVSAGATDEAIDGRQVDGLAGVSDRDFGDEATASAGRLDADEHIGPQ